MVLTQNHLQHRGVLVGKSLSNVHIENVLADFHEKQLPGA